MHQLMRYFIFHNGPISDLAHFELTPREMDRLDKSGPSDPTANLAAFYQLFMFQVCSQQAGLIAASDEVPPQSSRIE